MAQWVKDLALSLLWSRFDPWPRSFCILWVQPKPNRHSKNFVCFYLKLMSVYSFTRLWIQSFMYWFSSFLQKKKKKRHSTLFMFLVLFSLKWIRSLKILLKQFDFRQLTFYNFLLPHILWLFSP